MVCRVCGNKSSQVTRFRARTSPWGGGPMVGTDDGASDGWPDVLDRPLRSLVNAAEAAVPGGLEGGPGDIRPHDVFAILEKQARKHGPNRTKSIAALSATTPACREKPAWLATRLLAVG